MALLFVGTGSVMADEMIATCTGITTPSTGTNNNCAYDTETNTFSWTASNSCTKTLFSFTAGTLSNFTKLTLTTSDLAGSGSGNQYRIIFMTGSTTTKTQQFASAGSKTITLSGLMSESEIAGITEIRIGGSSAPGSGASYSVVVSPSSIVLHTEKESLSIASASDWTSLYQILLAGQPSTINAQMTADVTVSGNYGLGKGSNTSGAGNTQVFSGTFDGQGHTLTFTNESVTESVYAPFRFVKDATIQNLNVAGTISSTKDMVASIVGFAQGTVSIQNCGSTMSLSSSNGSTATSGGILALGDTDAGITINNCLFAGSLTGYRGVSGIAGYFRTASGQTISNTLNLGTVTATTYNGVGSRNIYRVSSGSSTITNCYYMTNVGTATDGTLATTAQLQSGEIAYTLQGSQTTQYWGQSKLNTSVSSLLPELTSDESKKVIKLSMSNGTAAEYANKNGAMPSPVDKKALSFNNGSGGNPYTSFSADATMSRCFNKYALTVTAVGATTLVLPVNIATLPSGVKAYDLTYTSGNEVTANEVTSITANKPVLINAEAGTYIFESDNSSEITYDTENAQSNGALNGIYTDTYQYVPASSYVLQNGTNGLGFYKVADANTVRITSFRAYLTAETEARALSIVFADDDETTGICSIKAQQQDGNAYYTLSGVRVSRPTSGIYIKNGRKVVIK